MVQVDFFKILKSREQASESQFEFALPKNIYKRFLRLSGVTKQTISNVSLEIGDWLFKAQGKRRILVEFNLSNLFILK